MSIKYNCHLGAFDYWHKNPPKIFNPTSDRKADARYNNITTSMEKDGYYKNHTREECKEEWHRRYELLKERS